MPDLGPIKSANQIARDERGRFLRGRSGDPASRAAVAMSTPAPRPANGLAMPDLISTLIKQAERDAVKWLP